MSLLRMLLQLIKRNQEVKKPKLKEAAEMPCCHIVSTEWYISDGKQRFICPNCRSIYVVEGNKLILENDKRIKISI
ncbi:MAG: hypothetical protein ACTSV6_07800 [Candidatus Heimdallarchaeota archaeon]